MILRHRDGGDACSLWPRKRRVMEMQKQGEPVRGSTSVFLPRAGEKAKAAPRSSKPNTSEKVHPLLSHRVRLWQASILLARSWCYAEVSSQKTSCRQPNALVWSLPRRSSAIACSRIQAMKRSTGMGVPCKPLPGQQLEQACPFPGLKRATWRVEKP